jgi:hypothetical protein
MYKNTDQGAESQGVVLPADLVEVFSFNGNPVSFRTGNGLVYVNMTEVAKAFPNKNLSQIINSQEMKDYLKAFCNISKYRTSDLLIVKQGGDPQQQGTWAHRKVAVRVGHLNKIHAIVKDLFGKN